MPSSRTGTCRGRARCPRSPLAPISTAEQVRPAAPMSWMAMTAPDAISSRQASSRHFSVNGSPTCTVGRFSSMVVVELGRGHGRAADAVAAGLGAEIDHRQADALGFRQEDLVGLGDARGEGVDQACCRCSAVELDLAADGRHAEGIAVTADTGDDAGDQVPGLGMVRRAEAQRVHRRDRAARPW
jgi:hypothetical protein